MRPTELMHQMLFDISRCLVAWNEYDEQEVHSQVAKGVAQAYIDTGTEDPNYFPLTTGTATVSYSERMSLASRNELAVYMEGVWPEVEKFVKDKVNAFTPTAGVVVAVDSEPTE